MDTEKKQTTEKNTERCCQVCEFWVSDGRYGDSGRCFGQVGKRAPVVSAFHNCGGFRVAPWLDVREFGRSF